MTQLANLVEVKAGVAPQSLNHVKRLRAVKVTGTLAPGYTVDDALKAMDDVAKRVLPGTAQTDLDGQSREFRASGSDHRGCARAMTRLLTTDSTRVRLSPTPFRAVTIFCS